MYKFRKKYIIFNMKIISFALWGDNKFYTYGAVENVILAKELFPDWICRFYIGRGVQNNVIEFLKSQKNVQIIMRDEPYNLSHMMWRFEPLFEKDVDVMVSRDVDSRLSKKEQIIVNEWLKSDKDFHIIRDSKGHKKSIHGGLFGARNGICLQLKKEFDKFPRINQYSNDQKFLWDIVYPLVKNKSYVSDAGFYPDKFTDEVKHPMPKGFENIVIGDRIPQTPIASKIFKDEQKEFTRERCE